MANEKISGTCQACFGTFAIRGELMVLHGYTRPGCGYTLGKCWGVRSKPYELDCKVTIAWRTNLVEEVIPGLHKTVKTTQASTELTAFVTDYSQPAAPRTGRRPMKPLLFVKGVKHDHGSQYYSMSFESVQAREISRLQGQIEQLGDLVKELDRRIAAWVYAPEKLVRTDKTIATVHAPGYRPGDALCRRANWRSRAGMNTTSDLAKVTCPKCLAETKARSEKAAKKALDAAKPV